MKKNEGKPRSLSRREFVIKSAQALAVIGFPTIIPASALGRSGTVAPSERMTLAHIGCGKMGLGLRGGFSNLPDTQFLATADVVIDRAKEFKTYYEKSLGDRLGKEGAKGVDAYLDYNEILARPDIDGVVISTPDHWHAPITIAAARAGKDVYCEKPLTHLISEAYAVRAAVQQYGTVLQTGSMQRSSREFRFAVEMVRNGRIGKVHTVNVDAGGPPHFFYDLPEEKQTIFDWDRWVGPSTYRPYNSIIAPLDVESEGWASWRHYSDFGGGGQVDWGAHMYDIAQWGLRRDGQCPVEIIPAGQKGETKLTYIYPDGVVMRRSGNVGFPGIVSGVEFIGDKGSIYVTRGVLETNPGYLKNEPTRADEETVYNSTSHYSDFISCMKTRENPICNAEVGASSAVVCALGNLADLTKSAFKFDYAKGLSDNAEVNKYLNQVYRGQYVL